MGFIGSCGSGRCHGGTVCAAMKTPAAAKPQPEPSAGPIASAYDYRWRPHGRGGSGGRATRRVPARPCNEMQRTHRCNQWNGPSGELPPTGRVCLAQAESRPTHSPGNPRGTGGLHSGAPLQASGGRFSCDVNGETALPALRARTARRKIERRQWGFCTLRPSGGAGDGGEGVGEAALAEGRPEVLEARLAALGRGF